MDLSSSIDHISAHRSPVTLSASNYMDCVLPRPREARSPTAIQNITSVLCDVQLEQYIGQFMILKQVILNIFAYTVIICALTCM